MRTRSEMPRRSWAVRLTRSADRQTIERGDETRWMRYDEEDDEGERDDRGREQKADSGKEVEVEGRLKKGNQANGWAITGPGGKFMKIYS